MIEEPDRFEIIKCIDSVIGKNNILNLAFANKSNVFIMVKDSSSLNKAECAGKIAKSLENVVSKPYGIYVT